MLSFPERIRIIQQDKIIRVQKQKEEIIQNKTHFVEDELDQRLILESEVQQFLELQKKLRDILALTDAENLLRQIQDTFTYNNEGKIQQLNGPYKDSKPEESDIKRFLSLYRDYGNDRRYTDTDRYNISKNVSMLNEGVYLGKYEIQKEIIKPVIGVWVKARRKSPDDIWIVVSNVLDNNSLRGGFPYDNSISSLNTTEKIEERLINCVR